MSRPRRILQKKFLIFCEGQTEYRYFDELRRLRRGELAFKMEPVDVKGGGYSNFLKKLRTSSDSDCLAKFVLLDLDRARRIPQERENLQELLDFCAEKNKTARVPHFLIVQNPDFEYVACAHFPDYRGSDPVRFLVDRLGYPSIAEFKAEQQVYSVLNRDDRSCQIAADTLRRQPCYITTDYRYNPKTFDIRVSAIRPHPDAEACKGSNMYELFDLIG